jgi:predicted acylesterase/phospholipase RssA
MNERINAPRARTVLSVDERERAANGLWNLKYLSQLGQRLLIDLVECCPVYTREHPVAVHSVEEIASAAGKLSAKPPVKQPQDKVQAPILAAVVLSGAARAHHRDGGSSRQPAKKKPSGLDLSVGTYGRSEGALDLTAFHIGQLRLELPSDREDSKLLVLIPEVLRGSPETLHRIIAAADRPELKAQLEKQFKSLTQPELILVHGDHAYASVLQPMAHTLAAAVGQSRPNTALVEYGRTMAVATWKRGKLSAPTTHPRLKAGDDLRKLVDVSKPGCVFVVGASDPTNFAPREQIEFNRIVYVTDRIPKSVPESLRRYLHGGVFDKADANSEEPCFVSFVPTILVPPRNPPPGPGRRTFEAMVVPHSKVDQDTGGRPRGLRPYRDACVVPVHRAALRRAWDTWRQKLGAGNQTHFLDAAVSAGALQRESADRWARAVTMRRVGVALSGGGACAYRFVPVLERLRHHKVPVDVFTGLSGGALLGVFYCLRGVEGLRHYVNLGPFIQATMPLASWSTAPFELTTDYLLGDARVENLEVRLGAVTVALPDEGPPYGAVVVQGTLGEAARVSGTLPPVYAATEKNGTRYTDGGACTAVPARLARDCGADVILACNAIPGPENCNPFPVQIYGSTLSRLLRRLPPWDRMIDFQTWRSFQWQQTSKLSGDEADAFLEFPPSEISIAEPAMFMLARAIIASANKEGKKIDKAIRTLKKEWQKLHGGA